MAMRDRVHLFWTVLWLLTCLVSSCERSAKPQRRKSSSSSYETAAWQPNGPPPQIVIDLMARHGKRVNVSIANHDSTDVELAASIQIQRWRNGAWHPEQVLELRRDCASKVEPCMKLAPGAELFPPGFTDMTCGCKTCGGLAQGTYRAVVQTCDGKRRIGSTSQSL